MRAALHHQAFSGADSIFAGDQFQYMAWIRSSGEHVLAANDFDLRLGGHVFLDPMFLVSGLLWRAGLSLGLSYLFWLPFAVAALFLGFHRYTRRTLQPATSGAAAAILALFYVTPAGPALQWLGAGAAGPVGLLSGELNPAGSLLGYLPTALAVGLVPLFLLCAEQVLEPQLRSPGRSAKWYVGWCAAAGLAIAWLHPWQGETILLIMAGLLAWGRFSARHRLLLIPAAATAAPLVYYFFLARSDPAWRVVGAQSSLQRPAVVYLLIVLAPLVVLAIRGAARSPRNVQDRILLLWPLAGVALYYLSTGYSSHALEGLSLPLAVLSVRGWRRMRPLSVWAAAAAVAVMTVPGIVVTVQLLRDAVHQDLYAMDFTRDEVHALSFLDHDPTQGGVLSSVTISSAVPAFTGRRTWSGHPSWTVDYQARTNAVSQLFSGRLPPARTQQFLRRTGARFLLDDCEQHFAASSLGRLLLSQRHFGCVAVYELDVPDGAAAL